MITFNNPNVTDDSILMDYLRHYYYNCIAILFFLVFILLSSIFVFRDKIMTFCNSFEIINVLNFISTQTDRSSIIAAITISIAFIFAFFFFLSYVEKYGVMVQANDTIDKNPYVIYEKIFILCVFFSFFLIVIYPLQYELVKPINMGALYPLLFLLFFLFFPFILLRNVKNEYSAIMLNYQRIEKMNRFLFSNLNQAQKNSGEIRIKNFFDNRNYLINFIVVIMVFSAMMGMFLTFNLLIILMIEISLILWFIAFTTSSLFPNTKWNIILSCNNVKYEDVFIIGKTPNKILIIDEFNNRTVLMKSSVCYKQPVPIKKWLKP